MATADEITRIENSKADLKSAIEEKGVPVAPEDRLDTYADKVRAIPKGTGGAVNSVNGKKGDVLLTATDIPNSPVVTISGTTLSFENIIDVVQALNDIDEVIG